MLEQTGRAPRKRSKPSYFYSIVSITMVLFMLGILGLMVMFSGKVSDFIRENVQVQIILKDGLNEADILHFQKKLDIKPYIKKTQYVSKDQAAERMFKEWGEDLSVVDYINPLYASIEFNLKAAYANTDSLNVIEADLNKHPLVSGLHYPPILDSINENIRKVSLGLLIVSIILIVIAITLIDTTVRLAMYSNRFLIKSMQLVGATRWFIIKPFIGRSIVHGLISGLLAVGLVVGLLYFIQKQILSSTLLIESDELINFGVVFGAIILLGVLISWFSTYLSVSKYLRLKLDDLY